MDKLVYALVFLPSVLLIIFGIGIKYFKAYWLISGYNTMSKEKKKNVDIEKLAIMVGNFCFVLAAFVFIIMIFIVFELIIPAIISGILMVGAVIFLLVKAQKYDGNAINSDGTMKKSTKIIIGVVVAFLVLVFSGAGVLLYQSNKPILYEATTDALVINGVYGERIDYKNISNLYIKDSIPDITFRTNGSAVGDMLKGYFNVTGMGNVKLFINKGIKSYIYIETSSGTIILNSEDEQKTRELYDKIKGYM